jgi:4-aminobutyrate aminotransferase-like enzyme
VRGIGLLLAIELDTAARTAATCAAALARGVITLVSGDGGNVLAIAPPLPIDRDLLLTALDLVVASIP